MADLRSSSNSGGPNQEGESLDQRERRRLWVRQHPLAAIALLIAFAAADLWLPLTGSGQHPTLENFAWLVGLVVLFVIIFYFVWIHLQNRGF